MKADLTAIRTLTKAEITKPAEAQIRHALLSAWDGFPVYSGTVWTQNDNEDLHSCEHQEPAADKKSV